MKIAERIQAAIHTIEVGRGAKVLAGLVLLLVFLAMVALFATREYHSFNSPEAMDAAQVARNVAEGRGFTTDFIRPFSVYLVQKNSRADVPTDAFSTNFVDHARLEGAHPDIANAPLYPLLLAGLMKVWTPQWRLDLKKPFWSEGGKFRRYAPEFGIVLLNQALLAVLVLQTFFLARRILDVPAAWLAALITLGSDTLWKFSGAGISTLLLMVIFLALAQCLVRLESAARVVIPQHRQLFILALFAGGLTALGLLTRYSFGWMIIPVVTFLWLYGGQRRAGLAVTAVLAFATVSAPWLARNYAVSGTLFGTAGYAVVEGTFGFPGTRLMQSLNPDMTSAMWLQPYLRKLLDNLRYLLETNIFLIGGGWLSALFLAGLLVGLRQEGARRLRVFTLLGLGLLLVVESLGRTQISFLAPEYNTENLRVLFIPFIVIFAVAFFLTFLHQIDLGALEARVGLVVVLLALCWQPWVSSLFTRNSTISYPPYYPPDVQKISGWLRPDELMMSDIPWAVAWYGDRQCVWTTINSRYEFFQFHDYVKPVRALYLSLNTLDGKLFSECLQGGVDSWGNFVLKTVAANQLPEGFPLKNFPLETLLSGLYLTDRQRW